MNTNAPLPSQLLNRRRACVGNGSVPVIRDALRFSVLATCYAELNDRFRPEAGLKLNEH
jgi:hypothetical protein